MGEKAGLPRVPEGSQEVGAPFLSAPLSLGRRETDTPDQPVLKGQPKLPGYHAGDQPCLVVPPPEPLERMKRNRGDAVGTPIAEDAAGSQRGKPTQRNRRPPLPGKLETVHQVLHGPGVGRSGGAPEEKKAGAFPNKSGITPVAAMMSKQLAASAAGERISSLFLFAALRAGFGPDDPDRGQAPRAEQPGQRWLMLDGRPPA